MSDYLEGFNDGVKSVLGTAAVFFAILVAIAVIGVLLWGGSV